MRRGAAVDHAQSLRLGVQPSGELFFGQDAGLAQGGAAEKVIKRLGVRAELLHRKAGRQLGKQRLQRRLRGGAEHCGDAVRLHQLADGLHTGQQKADGQGLGFVKDHDAVGDIVQFAAAGGPVAVEGLEKLHGRGDDHRRIPIFRCEGFAVKRGIDHIAADSVVRAGVVFQDVFVPQDVPECIGGLVDDGSVGDHIDDPGLVVGHGVGERKGQGGNGLAAAGGDGQGVKAGGLFLTGCKAALQDLAALAVQRIGRGQPGGNVLPQFLEQLGKGRIPAARHGVFPHEGFGVQKVSVHQAGIEHPGVKGFAEIVGRDLRGAFGAGKAGLDLLGPGPVRLHLLFEPSN